MVRSSSGVSSSVVSRMPSSRRASPCARMWALRQYRDRPHAFAAKSRMNSSAVEPVPMPSRMPFSTCASAASAALILSSRASMARLNVCAPPYTGANCRANPALAPSPRVVYAGAKIREHAMAAPILVFDLDGTLVHTAPDLLDSLNHCLALEGIAPADPDGFLSYVGQGSRVMIERAFKARRMPLETGRLDRLQAAFLEHYVAACREEARFIPASAACWTVFPAKAFFLPSAPTSWRACRFSCLNGLARRPVCRHLRRRHFRMAKT